MKKKVCIIETDDALRHLLQASLSDDGYQVEALSNAYPLFEVSRMWPDVFLIEIELESINGLEICRWIKNQEETMNIPVILISGSPELDVLAHDSRADSCISKPVDLDELQKALFHSQHLTVL
jgi:DNA-binding response OmpR family regulator